MMYERIRGALASDDAQKAQGDTLRFRIRETVAWREHAGNLETEMLRRAMFFEIIDCAGDQGAASPLGGAASAVIGRRLRPRHEPSRRL